MKAPAAEVLPQVSIEGGEMISKTLRTVSARFALLITEDDGMSTAEYSEVVFYNPRAWSSLTSLV